MTAIVNLLKPADRQRLEDRRRELAEFDRLMRQPGGLAGSPEPPPIHARDTATERTATS
ncbi:MAG TPA: hypothetical protein VED20_15225 [Streptosporangiaceae bacterium]|nr:hypothetical protein [Streptosporangiaceae bacterium]